MARGFSIPDQLARLRAEVKTAGELVAGEFIDQARSGTNAARREEYQKLLAPRSPARAARASEMPDTILDRTLTKRARHTDV